ncbi:MAG: hypothetical protein Q4C95_03290 [Planctomycetia bacterium]|nr:hypothetical protein [Planctomycetia bacterium]
MKKNSAKLAVLVLLLIGAISSCFAQQNSSNNLFDKMEIAWQTIWTKFYSSETKLFYDFIESYETGHELDHLPTEAEVQEQNPNECGYGTAMEDCMISAGVLLSMVIDRYAVTQDESLKTAARDIFEGIELCATVHGASGFIARGVSPKAPKLVYINSSRDQVTHAVYSLWEYYHSSLADDEVKPRIRKLLSEVADRMIRNVIPENNYDFLCVDGTPCRRGICKMYNVMGHEAARLPMIYAAAWDATGKTLYFDQYRKYINEAVDMSLNLEKNTPSVTTYGLLQMQLSLNLLLQLETENELKDSIRQAMQIVCRIASERSAGVLETMKTRDLTEVAPNWRKAGGLNGEYRKTWYAVREAGELALIQLLATENRSFDEKQKSILIDSLLMPDYKKISTCGVYDLLGAYWKARRLDVL